MNSSTSQRLVIFGCGYVGSAVATDAVRRGLRVTALTRNPATAFALRAEGIETVLADLATDSWHTQVPAAPEFVLNCVSSGGGGVGDYRRSYVDGMASIVAWAQQHGAAGTVVYTSSTSVYPQGGGVEVDESAPTVRAGERGQLLLRAEAILRSANGGATPSSRAAGEVVSAAGMALAGEGTRPQNAWQRWFILRLAGIYGPDRQRLIDQVLAGEVSGIGSHRLNLIHRDDIVAAIQSCFQAPAVVADEIFNVADDGATTKAEMVEWLAGRLGVGAPRFSGQPAGQRRSLTPDRVIANAKLKGRLGWQPRYPTFREGYRAMLNSDGSSKGRS